jgi:predicted AAA+ superfamily ATPase
MRFEVRGHVERDSSALLETLLEDEAAIMVEGPRGSGKSTLLREVTLGRQGRILDLDDPATTALVRLDPAGALAGEGLLFIDEYQRVPEVLSALTLEVDRDPSPGRFLLAGSVSGGLTSTRRCSPPWPTPGAGPGTSPPPLTPPPASSPPSSTG